MAEPSERIPRDVLYSRVSKAPLKKVAAERGITPTALSTLCRAYRVPYPGSGHWTKLSLGLTSEVPPLPSVDDPKLDAVIIQRPPRVRRLAPRVLPPTVGEPLVEGKLVRPHWLVAEWVEDRERRRREALRSRDDWQRRNAPPEWSGLDKRMHRLFDGIFKSVEKRGGSISRGDKGSARATIDGEKIDFLIREKMRQVSIAADDKRRSYMTTDLVGTGKFEGAQVLKAWEVERAVERMRRAEEAKLRATTEAQKAVERARRDKLVELSATWKAVQNAKEMLSDLLSKPHDPTAMIDGRSLGAWASWALSVVEELEGPVTSPYNIFSAIAAAKPPLTSGR